jgi:hypothetical protein
MSLYRSEILLVSGTVRSCSLRMVAIHIKVRHQHVANKLATFECLMERVVYNFLSCCQHVSVI